MEEIKVIAKIKTAFLQYSELNDLYVYIIFDNNTYGVLKIKNHAEMCDTRKRIEIMLNITVTDERFEDILRLSEVTPRETVVILTEITRMYCACIISKRVNTLSTKNFKIISLDNSPIDLDENIEYQIVVPEVFLTHVELDTLISDYLKSHPTNNRRY